MKRVALGVEYDGTDFYGWQSQPVVRTIQTELEWAISQVADESIQVTCAGRTDAGVHAIGQVVHFSTKASRSERAWIFGVNAHLQNDVAITWAKEVSEKFHARYSAIERHYSYFIDNRPTKSPITLRRMTWYPSPLNIQAMSEASQYLIGNHDFSSFRAADCQSNSPVRDVSKISITSDSSIIRIEFVANAFLHHMVRNIVGVLLAVGTGKNQPVWVKQVLVAKDRRAAGITAPPFGLYLMKVKYPDEFSLPAAKKIHLVG